MPADGSNAPANIPAAQVRPSFFADALEIVAPTLRPGERLLAGKVYVFNADMLKDHLAQEAVNAAPADLSGMTDDELAHLKAHCANFSLRFDTATQDLHRAVLAEQSRRGLRVAYEGARA